MLHSDTHPSVSLILCDRHERKSIIQLIMLDGMEGAQSFVAKTMVY